MAGVIQYLSGLLGTGSNEIPVSPINPLPVTGSAVNAANVAASGAADPGYGGVIGYISGGNVVEVGSGNPLPVTAVGQGAQVEVIPTITAGAYTAGYVIGGIMHFVGVLAPTTYEGLLTSITLKFKGSVQTTEFDLYLFKANPSNGTYADDGAPTFSASDNPALIGCYPLTAAQSGLGTHTVYNLDGIGKQVVGGHDYQVGARQ